jgi:hypothetical protein
MFRGEFPDTLKPILGRLRVTTPHHP